MDIREFTENEKKITMYLASRKNCPLIIFNHFSDDGSSVVKEIRQIDNRDFNLLCVSNLNWEHDMSPWDCPSFSPDDTPCTGGADDYLALLLEQILPRALENVKGAPSHISIAGYSLAGLFALYACYQCDVFKRVASMSGSLWFPDFKEYVFSHSMKKKPEKIYLSLGDKEANARNQLLKTVQSNTEEIADYFKEQGLDVTWELNPGNHFREAALRSAKGIAAIL